MDDQWKRYAEAVEKSNRENKLINRAMVASVILQTITVALFAYGLYLLS